MKASQPRQVSRTSISSEATFPLRPDAWTATAAQTEDEDSVRHRVDRGQRLAGGAEDALALAYATTRAMLRATGLAGLEPQADAFRYHEIDVDLVPDDRIGR